MPRSAGGGSHRSGSHSSSHRSSSHRSSSHHSSHSHHHYRRHRYYGGYGYNSYGAGVSRSVPGYDRPARRFYYYDKNGQEHEIFSSTEPKRQSAGALLVLILFTILFVGAGILVSADSIRSIFPSKLHPDYTVIDGHIEDNAGLINDYEGQLEKALTEFQDKTGICPYILSVNDEEWFSDYDSLEVYAYEQYVRRFTSEKFFLIVYSEPETSSRTGFSDWKWEAVQGDDTIYIINENRFSRFQNDLHNGFLRTDYPARALTDAFSEAESYMLRPSVDVFELPSLGFSLIWEILTLLVMVPLIINWKKSQYTYYEDTAYNSLNNSGGNQYISSAGASGTQYGSSYGSSGYQSGSPYGNAGGQYGSSSYGNQYGGSSYGNQYGSSSSHEMEEISLGSTDNSYHGPEIR